MFFAVNFLYLDEITSFKLVLSISLIKSFIFSEAFKYLFIFVEVFKIITYINDSNKIKDDVGRWILVNFTIFNLS